MIPAPPSERSFGYLATTPPIPPRPSFPLYPTLVPPGSELSSPTSLFSTTRIATPLNSSSDSVLPMIVQDAPRPGRLTLVHQSSAGQEEVPIVVDGQQTDRTKTVHVQVKNSPFQLEVKLSGTDLEAKPLDFNSVELKVTLHYDTEPYGEVHFVKTKPIDFKMKVKKDPTEAILRCRISILTSQHEGLNFRARVEAIVPSGTLQQEGEEDSLVFLSAPIRVISKPEQLPGRQGKKSRAKKRTHNDMSHNVTGMKQHVVNHLLQQISIPQQHLHSSNPSSPGSFYSPAYSPAMTPQQPYHSPLTSSQEVFPTLASEAGSSSASSYCSSSVLSRSNPDLLAAASSPSINLEEEFFVQNDHRSTISTSDGAHLQLVTHLQPGGSNCCNNKSIGRGRRSVSSSSLPTVNVTHWDDFVAYQPEQQGQQKKRRLVPTDEQQPTTVVALPITKNPSVEDLLSQLLGAFSALPTMEQRSEAIRKFARNCDSKQTEQATELVDLMASALRVPSASPLTPGGMAVAVEEPPAFHFPSLQHDGGEVADGGVCFCSHCFPTEEFVVDNFDLFPLPPSFLSA
ncbi:hypothetical protein QOT17_003546 [Balamuthia mandrillaris]